MSAKYKPSARIQHLQRTNKIVGEYVKDVSMGLENVYEILHGTVKKRTVSKEKSKESASKNGGGGSVGVLDGGISGVGIGDIGIGAGLDLVGGVGDLSPLDDDASELVFTQEELDQAKAAREKGEPMNLHEITNYFTNFLHTLHEICVKHKRATFQEIWQSYHDLAVRTLYPWDRDYLSRMPPRRDDGSIFLSIATYRDENCINTLTWAYEKAKNPDKLFVGLVQQNCEANCRSGVLEGGRMTDVEPDEDCHRVFCESDLGRKYCENDQIRALHVNETESLGPYAARYFASKLWYGEQWFMQIDAHMTFLQDWDHISIEMLQNAPSKKPVLSHYPPSDTQDLVKLQSRPAPRLCGPIYADSDLEAQIIRLQGQGVDSVKLKYPRFAPFTAAGYFVAHSQFLSEVPFDPFLPWIFMGEEIIMSTRLWTSGYDIFSPTTSVVGHIYVRRHKPKFWESVHRVFTHGVHNPLQALVLSRIKYQLGYPEAAKDFIQQKSILTAVEQYTMGSERPLEEYMKIVGLNMTEKVITHTGWCEKGEVPPGFEQYKDLYPRR